MGTLQQAARKIKGNIAKDGLSDIPQELKKLQQNNSHTYSFIHNTEKAPAPIGEDRFGQKIEPAGKYLTLTDAQNAQHFSSIPNHETGTVKFNNPLIIDGSAGSKAWKQALSKQYDGKVGKNLTQALIKDGYDGIITMDGKYPSESIHFDRQLSNVSQQPNSNANNNWAKYDAEHKKPVASAGQILRSKYTK